MGSAARAAKLRSAKKAFFSKAQVGSSLDAEQLIASFDEQMELE